MTAAQIVLELPWLHWGLVTLCGFCLLLLLHVIVLRRTIEKRTSNLRMSQLRLSTILDNAGALVFIKDTQLRYQYVNQVTADLFGIEPEAITGRDDFAFFDADTAEQLRSHDRLVLQTQQRTDVEQTFAVTAVGEPQSYLAVKVPLWGADGELTGICTYATNVTEMRRAGEALRLAATIFESQEGMLVTDAERKILRVNRALVKLTEFTDDELIGRSLDSLQSGRNDAAFFEQLWSQVADTGQWTGEMWIRRKSGTVYPAWVNIASVEAEGGGVTHYVSTQMDVSDRKAAEEEIRTLAYYDALTGLANRRLMSDRLQRSLGHTASHALSGALLVVDLDNFKDLNDTLGHDVGDALLRQAAERLEQCVRRGDTVARLGGDEFVLLIEGLGADAITAAAEAEAVARKVLFMMGKPFALGDRTHQTSCSIGIALFANASGGVDELLKRGDLAMYEAKAQGRNTLCFFDPRTQEAVAQRTQVESDLRRALEGRQLVLYYQPQVEAGGRLLGAEALLRWQHPERGLVGPDDFIAIAEATGLIVPIGAWVLQQACAQLQRWSVSPQTADLTLAVNVSMRQFRQITFVDDLLAVLCASGANPARLKLELTESLLLENADSAIAHMTKLRNLGVRFSLDDFGTGYSSLSYLKRLPLDQLKIDQSFVRDVMTDANDAAIARTVVALAQSLDLSVIAEGVETEEQRALLESFGCTAWQGYLFGRPAPVDDMLAPFLQTHQAVAPIQSTESAPADGAAEGLTLLIP